MNSENPTRSTTRRSFGVGSLVVAIAASAAVAATGTWLITGRGGSPQHADGHAETAPAKEQWQCPMHPSIIQDHPGDCPICGMKLVKIAGASGGGAGAGAGPSEPQAEKWQCPMHPSIVEDHPGDCPICGMKLVKVAATAGPAKGGSSSTQPQAEKWQCPMHPSIVQDHPGDCPICGMKLVKIAVGGGAGGGSPEGLAGVTIDPARQQLIGMKIVHAERGPVGGSWRTSARLAVAETRVHKVNVRIGGFIERVYADFIGKPVQRGEPLYSIYSPELFSAQEEYLLALRTQKTMGGGSAMSADGDSLVRASRRKLELWGVPTSEIERIEVAGEASRTVTFYSPATGALTKKDVVPGTRVSAGDTPFEIIDLSHLWGLADAYEMDLARVKVGMKASLTLKAFPGHTFEGVVAFVDPLLDPRTRTAKVRIDFPNPTGALRPEMFGEVVLTGKPRDALRIPADAVIESGTKSVVFVALADGRFQPREVRLGESDGTWTAVVLGLERGEGVVTRANFLVDSESRMRASLEALTAAPAHPAPAAGAAGAPAPAASPAPAPAADPHAGHRR